MKSLMFVLATLLIAGCSQGGGSSGPTDYGPSPQPGGIDSNLQPYVDDFETVYNVTVSYSVTFDSSNETGGSNPAGGTTVGVCRVWSDGRREVLVNKSWWDSKGALPRKLLIYHELGHCQFDRDHDTRTYSNGMPFTIMNPILNPVITYYPSNLSYYNHELNNPIATSVVAGGAPPSNSAAGYVDDSVIQVKEFHELGSVDSETIGCETVTREYAVSK